MNNDLQTKDLIIEWARKASIEVLAYHFSPKNIEKTCAILKPGRRVYIPSQPNKNPMEAIQAAVIAKQHGFDPVPHVTVRTYQDLPQLEEAFKLLQQASIHHILLLAGDGTTSGGIHNTIELLGSAAVKNLFESYGLTDITFGGHPTGNPHTTHEGEDASLKLKNDFVRDHHLNGSILTQICFNPQAFQKWENHINIPAAQSGTVGAGAAREHYNRMPVYAGIYAPLQNPARILRVARFSGFRWQQIIRNGPAMLMSYVTGKIFNRQPIPDKLILSYARGNVPVAGLHVSTYGDIASGEKMLQALEKGDFEITHSRLRGACLKVGGFSRLAPA